MSGCWQRTRFVVGAAIAVVLIAACASSGSTAHVDPTPTTTPPRPIRTGSFADIIPKPVQVTPTRGTFTLGPDTTVTVTAGASHAHDAVALLRDEVERATGYAVDQGSGSRSGGTPRIIFTRPKPTDDLSAEGYEVSITPSRITVAASSHDGFIWATQTLRQILPTAIDNGHRMSGTWRIPTGTIRDRPRYPWRGYLLDVARRFVPVDDVEQIIDELSAYKLDRLHLHLTDDQGWRLEIPGHPELTQAGAAARLGGGGGFYTVHQYRSLVRYGQARGVTIVPEIDMPGHVTAALIADPSLACDGAAPDPVPPVVVSDNALCPTKDAAKAFVDDIIAAVAKLTPGRWLHIGGDEAQGLSAADYAQFVRRAAKAVHKAHKIPIGWDEIAALDGPAPAIVQAWHYQAGQIPAGLGDGPGVIASPANHAYLDQKNDDSMHIGWNWAGSIDTEKAYSWDPATAFAGVPPDKVLGVEACMWTNIVGGFDQIEQLTLPRLPGYAEIGWSAQKARSWAGYRRRLAAQAPRWHARGWRYYADPDVPWQSGGS